MKIVCPECRRSVPVEHISLETGWGKCAGCHDVFRLSDVLDGYRPLDADAEAAHERPFDAWAVVQREGDQMIVHIPPEGMRAGTWALLGFTTFWLAFIAFWTAGALGVFFGGQIQPANVAFAAFSTPFWLVGFGMLGATIWMARGTRTAYFAPDVVAFQKKCLIWRRRRSWPRTAVQHARAAAMQSTTANQHAPSKPGVEVVYENGSFLLPCNSEAEQSWLLSEINRFLRSAPTN